MNSHHLALSDTLIDKAYDLSGNAPAATYNDTFGSTLDTINPIGLVGGFLNREGGSQPDLVYPRLWPNDCFNNVWVVQGQEAAAYWLGSHPEPIGQNTGPQIDSQMIVNGLKTGAYFFNSSGQVCMSAATAAAFNKSHSLALNGAAPTTSQVTSSALEHPHGGTGDIAPNTVIGCVGIAGSIGLIMYGGALSYIGYTNIAVNMMKGLDNIEACANAYLASQYNQQVMIPLLNQLGQTGILSPAYGLALQAFTDDALTFNQQLIQNPANVNLGPIGVTNYTNGAYETGVSNADGSDQYGYGGTGSLFGTEFAPVKQQIPGHHVANGEISLGSFVANGLLN